MRKLASIDIFAFCRVVTAIGIKDEVKSIAMKVDKASDLKEELGFDLLFNIFEKATAKKGEKALFEFFAGIFEMSPEDVSRMDPVDFMDTVLEAADIEKWKAFFSRVAALMQRS